MKFLRYLSLITLLSIISQQAVSGTWTYSTEVDEMTNEVTARYVYSSKPVISSGRYISSDNYSFIVRTSSKNCASYDVNLIAPFSTFKFKRQTFRVKVDKNPIIFIHELNQTTAASSGTDIYYFTDAIRDSDELVKQMIAGNELLVDFNTKVVRFSLQGFTKAYNKMCK